MYNSLFWSISPQDAVTQGGFLVDIVDDDIHGLRRNRISLSYQVTLASGWGGAMIEAAWSQVCEAVGLRPQWEAAQQAAVASVERAAAGLSILARSLLSLGMGRNGYVPPTLGCVYKIRFRLCPSCVLGRVTSAKILFPSCPMPPITACD